MGRARRARKIAQAAAYGGGVGVAGLGAVGLAGYAVLRVEAKLARRIVGQPFEGAPDDSGTYGFGHGDPIQLVFLGDSTAKGMGAEDKRQTIGAIIAGGIAAFSGRSVELTNVGLIGAESLDLDRQVDEALAAVPAPDIALISIGANDVTHRIDRSVAVRHLEMAVRRLREAGAEVVVGTCPDLGAVEPLAQPLKLLARRWSRDLAAAQTVAVVEAGGRAVSVGDMLSDVFAHEPHVMFSKDRFHPSPAGYARLAAALLPTVVAALGLFGQEREQAEPALRRGEGIGPVAVAATRAVAQPGTEVAPAEVGGQPRGPQGRWAMLLHRVRPVLPMPLPGLASDEEAPAEEPRDETASVEGTGAQSGRPALVAIGPAGRAGDGSGDSDRPSGNGPGPQGPDPFDDADAPGAVSS